MGFKVIFSDNFVNDLRDITSYISKDNPQAAITLGDASRVAGFGRSVPGRSGDRRRFGDLTDWKITQPG